MRARHLLAPLLAVALSVAASAPAVAQEAGRATVRLDGRALFRVSALDTLGARQRAASIERALLDLVDLGTGPARAVVELDSAGRPLITVSGVPVVSIGAADTLANGRSATWLSRTWSARIAEAVSEARADRSTPFARFRAEVRASVRGAFAGVTESAIVVIPRLLAALLVLLLFWLVATGVRFALRHLFRVIMTDITLESLILQASYYAVWVIGAIVAVGALGLEPTTVATALGLTGIALGFALKDILSNFVSGLLILLLRPFRLGDQIVVGETEGTVERIELRATQIRTYDGRSALVPNAEVFTSRLINNTATPIRRGDVSFYLGYEADLERAADVVRVAVASADGVLAEPAPSVRIRELTPDDVVLDVRFWTDSRRSDFLDTASSVRSAVLPALAGAGIALPDPDTRFVVRRGGGDDAVGRASRDDLTRG